MPHLILPEMDSLSAWAKEAKSAVIISPDIVAVSLKRMRFQKERIMSAPVCAAILAKILRASLSVVFFCSIRVRSSWAMPHKSIFVISVPRFRGFVLITEIWDPIREFEEKRKRSVEGER